jgi:hypothetical protein
VNAFTSTPLDGAWMSIRLQTALSKGKAPVNVTDPVNGHLTTATIKVDSGKTACFVNLTQLTTTQYALRVLCVDAGANWHLTSANNVYDQLDNVNLANDWPRILFVANGKSKSGDDVSFSYEGTFILQYKLKAGKVQSLKLATKGAEGMASLNDHSNGANLIDATGKAKLTASFIKDDTDTTVLPADAKTCLAVAKGAIVSPGPTFDHCNP